MAHTSIGRHIISGGAMLHPLEYVAMNALAGGTRGAYENFELDYWSAAASEALRRLEHAPSGSAAALWRGGLYGVWGAVRWGVRAPAIPWAAAGTPLSAREHHGPGVL